MTTPIYDFLKQYLQSDALRLHMPGHKGRYIGDSLSCNMDITEISGAGDLFEDSGIIAESEKNASELFATGTTCYSAGGSTLCIQTMLRLVFRRGRLLAARDCHRAFLNAAALLGYEIDWIYPLEAECGELSGAYAARDFAAALERQKYDAVYITSVNYYGYVRDTAEISRICGLYDTPLIADNAHGAHLAFSEEHLHPIAAGADMCCDSAHKTLPALTGAAYIHSREKFAPREIKHAMGVFGSTSPSYLITASLDLLNGFLESECRQRLSVLIPAISEMKSRLSGQWHFCGDDSLHITVYSALGGLTGTALARILRENRIECEYADDYCVVLLLSPMNTSEDIKRLESVLSSVKCPRIRLPLMPQCFLSLPRELTLREAMLSPCREVALSGAVGEICARSVVPCPPAFPLIAAGERITRECAELLASFNVKSIFIVGKDERT